MPNTGTESNFEETTIDRLKLLGYRYRFGGDLSRDLHTVVRVDVLPLDRVDSSFQQLPPVRGVGADDSGAAHHTGTADRTTFTTRSPFERTSGADRKGSPRVPRADSMATSTDDTSLAARRTPSNRGGARPATG